MNIKRIHAFGCSLTHQHKWFGLHSSSDEAGAKSKHIGFVDEVTGMHIDNIVTGREPFHWFDEKKGVDVTTYAISGGAMNMQLVQYGNGVADGSIDKDDIIIWQLTNPARHGIFWDTWLDKNTVPLSGNGNIREYGVLQTHHAFIKNRLNMINRGLGYNPKTPIPKDYIEKIGHSQRNDETIYDQMWSLNGIAKRNPKTLVVYGWYDAFLYNGVNFKHKLDAFLVDNEIEFIEEPILEYVKRMGHPQSDTVHPHWHGYKAFTNEVLKIKLQQLGWIL